MILCRFCAENIFEDIFGGASRTRGHRSTEPTPQPSQRQDNGGRRQRRRKRFRPRSEKDVRATVQEWLQRVHPRAIDYFKEPGMLEQVLTTIATCIEKNDDPVQGPDDKCVIWHGDILRGSTYISAIGIPENVDSESLVASTVSLTGMAGNARDCSNRSQAVFRLVKPGEYDESVTYINRIFSFVFAADESFEELMRLPKGPFPMICGNQLCINIGHISVVQ